MKKNIMSAAVAATLLGASAANAVFVNSEGHGQALIYPFYTVEGGHDTYINLVNTTDQTKAVKVRFVEAMNSQEVLDFNLYLSPQDHWSAVVFADGSGASIRTADTSCTVPTALSAKTEGVAGTAVPFRNFTYQTDAAAFTGVDRTREGYVEIIEMGVLTDATDEAAAKHGFTTGVPANCGTLSSYWTGTGKWVADPNDDVAPPTGGLYGYGVLIDVQEGTNATYDAIALDDFISILDPGATAIHNAPGSILPGLGDATPVAQILDSSSFEVVEAQFLEGIDAVSAVLMHSAIMNDYVLEPTIAAGTDWVVTFPTKKEYVNVTTAIAPFTEEWDPITATACEAMAITYYDREERTITPDPLDFSPAPPGPDAFALCREANVLTFNDSNVLSGSTRVNQNLNVDYNNGWLELGFTGTGRELVSDNGVTFFGLPTVGFAVQKYVNGTLPGGVLSNYAGVVEHKNRRSVTSAP
ncbi:MAG: hypothetical protein RJQ10_16720 [Haliea sp.]|uniref:hypothetical protein n=1 Tax=Haliea sp. TaxID=1932666 RepID=UPI0032EE19FF